MDMGAVHRTSSCAVAGEVAYTTLQAPVAVIRVALDGASFGSEQDRRRWEHVHFASDSRQGPHSSH